MSLKIATDAVQRHQPSFPLSLQSQLFVPVWTTATHFLWASKTVSIPLQSVLNA